MNRQTLKLTMRLELGKRLIFPILPRVGVYSTAIIETFLADLHVPHSTAFELPLPDNTRHISTTKNTSSVHGCTKSNRNINILDLAHQLHLAAGLPPPDRDWET